MNVDFITAIKMFFANYANFKGRSTRAEYWWVMLFMFLVSCILGMLGTFGYYINYAFSAACLIPGMALGTRRASRYRQKRLVACHILYRPGGLLHLDYDCFHHQGT